MLEQVEGATAVHRVHDGAIYLHQGDSYLVTRLDTNRRTAYLRPVDGQYYTEPLELSETNIRSVEKERTAGTSRLFFGDVRVTEQIIGYLRKRQISEAVLARVDLDYPPQSYDTKALWWDIPPELMRRMEREGCDVAGALHAAEHACIGILPLFAMCDRWDIGGLSTPLHVDTHKPQIFIYDGFPGGVGISEKGYNIIESLWRATLEAIEACPCEFGCPSCIQSPKCGNNNEPLDKRGAILLLRGLLAASSSRTGSPSRSVPSAAPDSQPRGKR
jgi:DEAD/DEAH box helicase domain-containing protein